MMAGMPDRYQGPAQLRAANGLTIDVTVRLATHTGDGTYSWGGTAATTDPRALTLPSCTLIMPDGAERHVTVAGRETARGQGGAVLYLHGNGAAPY